MKNLIPYKDDCFEVHKNAVNKKHSSYLKDRLLKLNSIVEIEYNKFLIKFKTNELRLLTPDPTLAKSKDDLFELYHYQSKVISSVREKIRNLQLRTIINTCQNCTIDSVNTMDHVLPQSIFPEFIVNPKNLFPCCSTCNSYKLDSLNDEDGGKKFLNLYLDELPIEQYLFVEVFYDSNNELDFRFYLENVDNRISSDIFSKIEYHFSKLRLLSRMRLKAVESLSELSNQIIAFKSRLAIDEIINTIISSAIEDKTSYGYNYWKCILKISLLNSPIYIDKFK